MNDLDKALVDISSIRRQVAQQTQFRGYGPATLATTGVLALVAAFLQALLVPNAANHIRAYLILWLTTAVLAATLSGVQMYTRSRRLHSGLSDEMIHQAVEQFLPALVAGILITIVLVRFAPSTVWMLPGLWQLIYSLGVFSSCRFLPRPMLIAGIWYMLAALLSLSIAGPQALSPWIMGLSFGTGQFIVAGILYFASLETTDET